MLQLARASILGLTAVALLGPPSEAQCPAWQSGFELPGMNGAVDALVVFDDGSGPALYAGGSFHTAGASTGSAVARWDGIRWSGLAPIQLVRALAVFDDGSGPALYAGGSQVGTDGQAPTGLHRWTGTSWENVGGTIGIVSSLAVFDDGSGPALYAGGVFLSAGGVPASGIARWDGTSWSALGAGTDAAVLSMVAWDDGSGPALYVAGSFQVAGGLPVDHVARWDGASWSGVGGGVDGSAFALAVHDDGSGPALYVGGDFHHAGGVPIVGLARWDGGTYAAVGAGPSGYVRSLASLDEGNGPRLIAGAYATPGSGSPARVTRWDGVSWVADDQAFQIGNQDHPPFAQIRALSLFDDGSGPRLFAGGDFTSVAGLGAQHVAVRGSAAWGVVGSAAGLSSPFLAAAQSAAVHDAGQGAALYVGGSFQAAGDIAAQNVAAWDGASWSALGLGTSGAVEALAVFDDGQGPQLYAGGQFALAGGALVYHIARWNGVSWSALGSGTNAAVRALCVFDDGSGPALYVGGDFSAAGGVPAGRVARWNGIGWTGLDTGLSFPSDRVSSFAVFDDGGGPRLIAAGRFPGTGALGLKNIARWDGATWTNVGGGTDWDVHALSVFDDGSGLALYAGGTFGVAGGAIVGHLARWNGSTWSSAGPQQTVAVGSLAVFDDGTGPALFVGRAFANHPVERWDGATWSVAGGPVQGGVVAEFAAFASAPGEPAELYAVGGFQAVGGLPSAAIARWGGCENVGEVVCPGDGSGAACPCANVGLPGHGCRNSATIRGAEFAASGFASTSFDSLALACGFEPPGVTSIVLQGSALVAPVTFGDGLRCAGGDLKRLYVLNAGADGTVTAPASGAPSVSQRSAELGDPIAPGSARVYQVYYRDPDPSFCPEPQGAGFNASNGLRLLWMP